MHGDGDSAGEWRRSLGNQPVMTGTSPNEAAGNMPANAAVAAVPQQVQVLLEENEELLDGLADGCCARPAYTPYRPSGGVCQPPTAIPAESFSWNDTCSTSDGSDSNCGVDDVPPPAE